MSFWLYIHIASQDASINDVGRLVLPPVYLLHQFTIGLLRTLEAVLQLLGWLLGFLLLLLLPLLTYLVTLISFLLGITYGSTVL